MRWIEVHRAVTLELSLARVTPRSVDGLRAAEVPAGELDGVLAGAGLLVERAAAVGREPWRAFVVWADGAPIHHTFVTFETRVPRLFKVFTHPGYRRRGAFAAAVAETANTMSGEGYARLESSCNRDNAPSLAAHRRAGFRAVRTSCDPYVFGVRLRGLFRR